MAAVVSLYRPQPSPPKRRKIAAPAISEPITIKSAAGWRYQWHEEILKRFDLSRSEIAVAGVLMHHFHVGKGYAEIGLSALAKKAGCSRNRASIATQRLRSLGLLVVINEGVRRPGRALATCRYQLVYLARGIGPVGETT
jgi:hypothetical protein